MSNLAMAYAALMAYKNATKEHSYVQQTITQIRDFVFGHLLSGGTVLNGQQERTLAADQWLTVMPYGLFSPEDLVIVEASRKMSNQLGTGDGLLAYIGSPGKSPVASALAALYYQEKSEFETAHLHAEQADESESELAKSLLALYRYYLSEAKRETNEIVHHPLGNENVYEPQRTERKPHHPMTDEYVTLPCRVVTGEQIDRVTVVVQNEAKSWQNEYELTLKEDIYEVIVPPLDEHGTFSYMFKTLLENGREIHSDMYEMSTRLRKSAEHFRLIQSNENELIVKVNDQPYVIHFALDEQGLTLNLKQQIEETTTVPQRDEVTLDHKEYSLHISLSKPRISLYKKEELILSTHPLFSPLEWKENEKGDVEEFTIHWYSPSSEQFYGFGERYNATQQRGEMIDCYVYNQYRDQGTRTYIPIPFYMTNQGYGCFIDTQTYTSFDLAREVKDKCSWTIEQVAHQKETPIHIYLGSYQQQLKNYTNHTGKPTMLPAWALGPWMSSNNWDRQSIVEKEVAATKQHQIPATVIVLEQWSDEATYYMFNDAEYELKDPGHVHSYDEMTFPEWGRWPDPKQMVEDLHNENLKLILWQIPIQKYLNKQHHPLKDQDERYMIDKGYVVTNKDGTPYRIPENWFTNSLIMDFSHEEGRTWWFQKRQYLIDLGVDGFKTDGGEFVFGKDLQFANGQIGSEMRNQYPNDYIEAYYDFAQQNDGITFSRAGYTGAQKFPAHWAGDERSTFGAFKRSLIAGLNAGLAGIPFWGWDLAGFNGDIPTAELFMRSSSMAAFCPIMQYHAESKAEFSQDRTPWNIAERTRQDKVIDVYRYFANVRMNLLPYIYKEAEKASRTGLPMMRALMIDFPEDERVDGMYDQYMFGESLLVAPIIEEGAVTRSVYLPEGEWTNLWTDEILQGPTIIKAESHVHEIPVFVKMNTALLLNVDETRQFGSQVGNRVDQYVVPLLKVYVNGPLEHTVTDHLGNEVCINIKEEEGEWSAIVSTSLENLEVEWIGLDNPIRWVKE